MACGAFIIMRSQAPPSCRAIIMTCDLSLATFLRDVTATFLSVTDTYVLTYIRTYVHHENRSRIISLALMRSAIIYALPLAFEKLLISVFQFGKASSRTLHRDRGLLQKALHKLHAPIHIYSNSVCDPTRVLNAYLYCVYALVGGAISIL